MCIRDSAFSEYASLMNAKFVTKEVLEAAFHSCRYQRKWVIIADGIDELLLRHPILTFEGVLGAFEKMVAASDGHIVVGTRDVLSSLANVQNQPWTFCELKPQTFEELIAEQPEVRGVLKGIRAHPIPAVDTEELLQVFCTLLFSDSIKRRAKALGERVSNDSVHATSGCFAEVMKECFFDLMHNGLSDSKTTLPEGIDQQTVFKVISAISRVFYEEQLSVLCQKKMVSLLRQLSKLWKSKTKSTDATVASIAKSYVSAIDQFIKMEDNKRFWILRTIFVAKTGGFWEFSHRTWYEFFVAAHYADSARCGLVEEFGRCAYSPVVTGIAGQFMGRWDMPLEIVVAAKEKCKSESNSLFVSNLLAILVWNRHATIAGEAREAMHTCIVDSDIDSFSRSFVINGLLFRTTLANVRDGEKRSLIGYLKTATEDDNEFIRSLATCHLASIGMAEESTNLGEKDCHIDLCSPMWEFDESLTTAADTVQASLQPLIKMVANPELYGKRRVATIHYIFSLVSARARHKELETTNRFLEEMVFSEDSPIQKHFMNELDPNFKPSDDLKRLPSLGELFVRCKKIWMAE